MNLNPNLRAALDEMEDTQDSLYIIACAVNLYSECLRRRAGRVLYGPNDIQKLFEMAKMLLDIQDPGVRPPLAREPEPSEAEIEAIADPFAEIAEMVSTTAQRRI